MVRTFQNFKISHRLVPAAVTAGMLAGVGAIASPAKAACFDKVTCPLAPGNSPIVTLEDENSTVTFDLGNQAGLFDWVVDGVDQIFQEWFWYRLGDDGPEQSIDTLELVDYKLTDTDFDPGNDNLIAKYLLKDVFEVELNWGLTGAPVGTGTSDIAESIKINNISGGALDLSFFEYTDFDLSDTFFDDTVAFNNINVFTQMDNATMAQVSAIPDATAYEAGIFPDTLDKLNDGSPTNLTNTPPFGTSLGPVDATSAWQWDFNIARGGSVIISKDKLIKKKDVPEPGTVIALLAAGSLGLALKRRKLK
ncbi:MAG: PEP-CTERM sorting domain-containing protein [Cyanobacteriota bacterium]|nr:PEP-CTERM sorting domain-containing protein [Cyanobacteriota bacterium]